MSTNELQTEAPVSFADFDIAPEFHEVLGTLGYRKPTPIQQQSIPLILQGEDLIACAQTGSGKTAAYTLPVLTLIEDFMEESGVPPAGPMALVLVPTRELAEQVVEMAAPFAKVLNLRVAPIYGGVSMKAQIEQLRTGLEFIVATPGRLLDHMRAGRLDYRELEFFILDEADRMLDIGFLPDIMSIVAELPPERQTLLLSATMPRQVQTLADRVTKNPKRVTIGEAGKERPNMPKGITHGCYLVSPANKLNLLRELLTEDRMETVLIFTRTRQGADRLCRRLVRDGFKAKAIHGDLSQQLRQRALDGFKEGKCNILVATDVAARGIDVEGITHVINYDLPQGTEDYVHRVGRTGRADATGDAISFVTPEEFDHLKNIESAIKQAIPRLRHEELTYNAPSGGRRRQLGRSRRSSIPRRW